MKKEVIFLGILLVSFMFVSGWVATESEFVNVDRYGTLPESYREEALVEDSESS